MLHILWIVSALNDLPSLNGIKLLVLCERIRRITEISAQETDLSSLGIPTGLKADPKGMSGLAMNPREHIPSPPT